VILSTSSVGTDTTTEVYFLKSLISGSFCKNLAVVILTCCPMKRDFFITERRVSSSFEVTSRGSSCITTGESVGALLNSMQSCEPSGSTVFRAVVMGAKWLVYLIDSAPGGVVRETVLVVALICICRLVEAEHPHFWSSLAIAMLICGLSLAELGRGMGVARVA